MDTLRDSSTASHIQSEPILDTSLTATAPTDHESASDRSDGDFIEGLIAHDAATMDSVSSSESSTDVSMVREQKEPSTDVPTPRRTRADIIRVFTDHNSPLVNLITNCDDNRSLICYFFKIASRYVRVVMTCLNSVRFCHKEPLGIDDIVR